MLFAIYFGSGKVGRLRRITYTSCTLSSLSLSLASPTPAGQMNSTDRLLYIEIVSAEIRPKTRWLSVIPRTLTNIRPTSGGNETLVSMKTIPNLECSSRDIVSTKGDEPGSFLLKVRSPAVTSVCICFEETFDGSTKTIMTDQKAEISEGPISRRTKFLSGRAQRVM